MFEKLVGCAARRIREAGSRRGQRSMVNEEAVSRIEY